MTTSTSAANRHTILIIGAGTAGVALAARLRRARPALDIAIVEPSAHHYYQPAWTLVGGGQYDLDRTRRNTLDILPAGVRLVPRRVEAFAPEDHQVILDDGARLAYDVLIVAAGIQINWDAIDGLAQTLGRHGVSSNYRADLAPYTWECIRGLEGGTAVFTQPGTPIKCAGAPQKALYLAADHLRRRGLRADLRFYTATASMFGVPFYANALDKVMADYAATPAFGHNLVAVDGPGKTAYFETAADGRTTRAAVKFDFLHVVPPQSAPDFIRRSSLADAAGWLEVDKSTLQHARHPNIFGLGDCTSTPNSKTAAAVKSQVPVVARNVLSLLGQEPVRAQYDGYAACPLTTSAGKVLLAEFCYGGVVTPTLPLDPRVPRRGYWHLKKTVLPAFYWHWLLNGRDARPLHQPRDFPAALPPIRP